MKTRAAAWLGLLLLPASACVQREPEPTAPEPPAWMDAAERRLAGRPVEVRSRVIEASTVLLAEAGRAWQQHPTPSGSVLLHYTLPGPSPEESGTLKVYWFGRGGAGDVEANLRRWAEQMDVGGGDPLLRARITEAGATGSRLTRMLLDGRYVAETLPGSGVRLNQPGWRLDAGVFESRIGPLYIKVDGPQATLEAWSEQIDRFYGSLRLDPPFGEV